MFLKMYEYYEYSRKKQDYFARITELKKQMEEIKPKIDSLIEEVERFMKIYDTNDIRLSCVTQRRPERVEQSLAWNFDSIKRECKNNKRGIAHQFGIRVRDFNRSSDKDRVLELLKSKGDDFIKEFLAFEKKRISLNHAMRDVAKTIENLEKLSRNEFSLYELLETK